MAVPIRFFQPKFVGISRFPRRLTQHNNKEKKKVKVTLVQALRLCKAVRPIGGIEVLLNSFMTTALEGGEESASRPGRSLSPGNTRYPLYRRVGGPQSRSGQLRKISSPPGFDPRTVQPLAQSLYRLSYPAHCILIVKN